MRLCLGQREPGRSACFLLTIAYLAVGSSAPSLCLLINFETWEPNVLRKLKLVY